jgi:cysteine synthase A
MIYSSAIQLIGNTPMVSLSNIKRLLGIKANIIAKLESKNPGGSAKDRIALAMVEDAERKGLLKKGGTIIEPTSGNTGIGLALVAALKGYRLIITMPESMSIERCKILKAYGAETVLTPCEEGMAGAISRANKLRENIPNSIILGQFANLANPEAHALHTAEEIWNDTQGNIDAIVACVGTGGTLCGISKRLKELNPHIKSIAVEPQNSPVLSGGKPGAHKIQGIGGGFIPPIYDNTLVDCIITVSDEEAYETTRMIAQKEGLLVGISSGAALCAAIKIAQAENYEANTIAVIFPDTGERYLSASVF